MLTEEEIKAAFVTAFNKLVTEREEKAKARFDEGLWGAMVIM